MAQLHFFQEPIPLDKIKHAKLKLDRSADLSYASNVNAVPVSGVEFFKSSRHFPVVFVKNAESGYMPLALLSLKKEGHDCGDQWEDTYVPNYIRRYPFVLSDENLVIIDNKAPQLSDDKGEALFNEPEGDAEAEPSDVLKGVVSFLEQAQMGYKATEEFVKALIEHDMLQPFSPTVKLGEASINLGELFIINEKKLVELPDAVAVEWLKKGWIAWSYAQLHSLESINDLIRSLVKNGVPSDMAPPANDTAPKTTN